MRINCLVKNKFKLTKLKVFIYEKTKKGEFTYNLGKDTGDIKFPG